MYQNLKQTKHSGRAKARWAFEPACAMQFAANIKRDKLVKRTLKKQGRRVMEVWECEVKPEKIQKTLNRLILKLI